MIASYNRVIEAMSEEGENGDPQAQQAKINMHVDEFVQAFKSLTDFDDTDEARVNSLVEQPELMDEMLKEIMELLD